MIPLSLSLSQINTLQKQKDFIYIFCGGRGGRRKTGRETSVCERNITWLPLTCPQLETCNSVHWATPSWVSKCFFNVQNIRISQSVSLSCFHSFFFFNIYWLCYYSCPILPPPTPLLLSLLLSLNFKRKILQDFEQA